LDGVISSTVLPGFQFRESDLYKSPELNSLIHDPVYKSYVRLDLQAAIQAKEKERQAKEREREAKEKERQAKERERQAKEEAIQALEIERKAKEDALCEKAKAEQIIAQERKENQRLKQLLLEKA
jgi:flagellar biosynthesis GTPase FlhF